MRARGFTVVELIIVITIMTILLTLAVVQLQSSQQNARDNERTLDVEAIATALEAGYPGILIGADRHIGYPGTSLLTSTGSDFLARYQSVNPVSLRTPNVAASAAISLIPATNDDTTPTGVRPIPTPSTYVYQPIDDSGGLCSTNPCRSFTIYYLLEGDATVQAKRSTRQ